MRRGVIAALVKASRGQAGEYVPILEVQAYDPEWPVDELLAAYRYLPAVSVTGSGSTAFVRYEGIIWSAADGTVGYVQRTDRVIQTSLEDILAPGMEIVACP